MRVIYEGAIFDILGDGGIARYFQNLIEHLPKEVQATLVVPEHSRVQIRHPSAIVNPIQTEPALRLLRRWLQPKLQRAVQQHIEVLSGDVIHWTYYSGLCRSQVRQQRVPSVVTVYDFIHESFSDMDRKGTHAEKKRHSIATADRLCCISQTTYDELCDRMPEAASKARVTRLGNTFSQVQAGEIPETLRNRPYILFVGRRQPYKNFDALWQAFSMIRSACPDLHLAIAGPPMKSKEAARLGIHLDDPRVVLLGKVSDATLKQLYAKSLAFVFPSKREGFGLPALEAMESNANLIASNCDALREVGSDAGHFFDAEDMDTLASLLQLANHGALPDATQKREAGKKRAAELTWQCTAAATLAVYEELATGNQHQVPSRQAA